MSLVDAIGVVHDAIDLSRPPRIVSLVPSITELLCDLGLEKWLVGRTGFCIHPADSVRSIAKIGGTKDVNIDKIIRLAPTHLIVNIDENQKPTVDTLARHIAHVVVTHPLAPNDNLVLYRLLGGIFDCRERAEILCAEFTQAAAACRPTKAQRVLYCIWKDPWMTVSRDTYIARMLAHIDWIQWDAPTSAGRYPVVSWTDSVLAEIDLVLLSSEPYRFDASHVDALARQIDKPVLAVNGEMLSWYGSRAIAGMHYLHRLGQQNSGVQQPRNLTSAD